MLDRRFRFGLSEEAVGIYWERQPPLAVDAESEALSTRLQAHIDGDDISPSEYEALCMAVLIKLFDPTLYGFEKQATTTDGGNRYDFICRIKAGNHFWDSLRQDFRTKAILFECKNYSDEIGPDQIYSTERYLFSGLFAPYAYLSHASARTMPQSAPLRVLCRSRASSSSCSQTRT
ncbi:hypothetical protein FJ420_32320 [Mesorhizobium sp. B3-1-3]|uniref:hypothetical protein n=1 Tax=unclassified Mesorhizobium TaxID=325217 RepID=UPI00112C62DF|nr:MULTISPECIES: hypothetical protein [unclassified Mesorhizobium]TPI52677.1 hypothetical protein FJ424_32790 [Mesorhizobium sp. B3-1-8]TPI59658.1 hypothetical protein FJ420_32320 [Mesorhizobium sp. B3-1-3]